MVERKQTHFRDLSRTGQFAYIHDLKSKLKKMDLPMSFSAKWISCFLAVGLPIVIGVEAQAKGNILKVCHQGCVYNTLAQAAEAAQDGDTIQVQPGEYSEGAIIRANKITLMAKPGAHLKRAMVEEKAALVIKGEDAIIDGLECSDVYNQNRNGACIRQEGRNVTVRHVHFHDGEEGILAAPNTGVIRVEDSVFERFGSNGFSHAIYVNDTDAVILLRSQFLASTGEGHEVKSRAAKTVIDRCLIASKDGRDSRQVDTPNGGEVVIRNSVIAKGPASVNGNVIGFGLEGTKHAKNSLTLEQVTIISDRLGRTSLLQGPAKASIKEVTYVGSLPDDMPLEVKWLSTRQLANLPNYPALPELPR